MQLRNCYRIAVNVVSRFQTLAKKKQNDSQASSRLIAPKKRKRNKPAEASASSSSASSSASTNASASTDAPPTAAVFRWGQTVQLKKAFLPDFVIGGPDFGELGAGLVGVVGGAPAELRELAGGLVLVYNDKPPKPATQSPAELMSQLSLDENSSRAQGDDNSASVEPVLPVFDGPMVPVQFWDYYEYLQPAVEVPASSLKVLDSAFDAIKGHPRLQPDAFLRQKTHLESVKVDFISASDIDAENLGQFVVDGSTSLFKTAEAKALSKSLFAAIRRLEAQTEEVSNLHFERSQHMAAMIDFGHEIQEELGKNYQEEFGVTNNLPHGEPFNLAVGQASTVGLFTGDVRTKNGPGKFTAALRVFGRANEPQKGVVGATGHILNFFKTSPKISTALTQRLQFLALQYFLAESLKCGIMPLSRSLLKDFLSFDEVANKRNSPSSAALAAYLAVGTRVLEQYEGGPSVFSVFMRYRGCELFEACGKYEQAIYDYRYITQACACVLPARRCPSEQFLFEGFSFGGRVAESWQQQRALSWELVHDSLGAALGKLDRWQQVVDAEKAALAPPGSSVPALNSSRPADGRAAALMVNMANAYFGNTLRDDRSANEVLKHLFGDLNIQRSLVFPARALRNAPQVFVRIERFLPGLPLVSAIAWADGYDSACLVFWQSLDADSDGCLGPKLEYAHYPSRNVMMLDAQDRMAEAKELAEQRRAAQRAPLAFAKTSTCSACFQLAATGVKMKLCSRCKNTRYCSEACQRRHWPEHKGVCGKL